MPGVPGVPGSRGPSGSSGPSGPQGIQGPKGPSGSRGPTGSRGPSGPQGHQGPKAVPSVYFSAWYSSNSVYPKKGETLIFNRMISNKGNGLNVESGVFKAPVAGFYFFTFTGETLRAESNVKVEVYQNSGRISSIGEDNGEDDDD